MSRHAGATALALMAVGLGEDILSAIDRATAAFGGAQRRRMQKTIERAALDAVSAQSKLEIEMRRLRSMGGSSEIVAALYAVSLAFGLTLAALALVIPSSAEVGLAGW